MDRMKPRYAAALALVGWYLMVPPPKSDGADLQWPLSEWASLQGFDTATECERAKKELQLKHPTSSSTHKVSVYEMASCVATDDRRLKPN
jgi:hypothetical protein